MAFQEAGSLGAIVADFGGCNTKIGFAGDDHPQVYSSSYIGVKEDDGAQTTEQGSKHSRDNYVFDIMNPHDNVEMVSPLKHGIVDDWDMMESMLDYHLQNSLQVDVKEYPFLLAEPALQPRKHREKWAQLLFEKKECPGIFMGRQGVLALYSVGKVSGISLDMGHSSSTLTPVHDGYPLMMGVQRNPVGGETMDKYFKRSLDQKKMKIHPSFMVEKDQTMQQRADDRSELAAGNVGVQQRGMFREQSRLPGGGKVKELPGIRDSFIDFHVMEILRDVRKATFLLSEEPLEERSLSNIPNIPYALPDGQVLQVDADRFITPELLFSPSPVSDLVSGCVPITQSIVDAGVTIDPAVRPDIASLVVVHGGLSGLSGLNQRLTKELKHSQALGTKPRVLMADRAHRHISSWLGGSILGSMAGFDDLWVTRSEWLEQGESSLTRKCP